MKYSTNLYFLLLGASILVLMLFVAMLDIRVGFWTAFSLVFLGVCALIERYWENSGE